MNKVGSIILLNNKKGILPFFIRFFTKSKYSHNAITMGNIIFPESVLSAESIISVYPIIEYDKKQYEYKVYELVGDEKLIEGLVRECYEEYSGTSYGFFQLLWFIYRRAAEFFGFDVRKQGNWFPEGTICSEVIYNFLMTYAQLFEIKELEEKLNEWNSNAFSQEDTNSIIKQFSKYFIEK